MDAVLLIGQSNMAGRGIVGDVPEIDHRGRMFMLRNGCWQPMSEPINPDRAVHVKERSQGRSGVSLAASFASEYVDTYDSDIGLIPCAYGSSSLDDWREDGTLYEYAVMNTRLALRTSRLRGILWHQGESDSKSIHLVNTYAERFERMINALKRDVGATNIPVVLGEITRKLERYPFSKEMNDVLHGIAASAPSYDIALSEGLEIGPDNMHYTAASYRLLGERYFQAYLRARTRLEA